MQDLRVIINNKNVQDTDKWNLFEDDEVMVIFPGNPRFKDMLDLLIHMGAFPSRSQARKNWKGPIEFPLGFNEFVAIGKLKRSLAIWNPSEQTE